MRESKKKQAYHVSDSGIILHDNARSFRLVLSGNPDSSGAAKLYGPGRFVIGPANEIHFEGFIENSVMDTTGTGL